MRPCYLLRVALAALVVAASFAWTAVPASAAGSIDGAGASFPQLEFEQWRSDIAKAPYDVSMNYVSSGSTFGRQQYVANLVDFGVSDIPFQVDELGAAGARPYVYVPVSAGGVGFMYNVKDGNGRRIGFPTNEGGTGTDLKLTPRTVCRIFTEQGIRWNDPEIQADNPDIVLPAQAVKPVNRADGAGTTYVFMEYCIKTAPEVWDAFIAYVNSNGTLKGQFNGDPFLERKPSSRMPALGPTAFASDGVANLVASDTAGANGITAVEAGFAEVRGFPNALVRNAANVFHYPESFNVNKALAYASKNGDGTVTLAYDANDADAYFPSSYSYVIAPKEIDAERGMALATFLQYAVTLGQERADQLGYAPLSGEMVTIALDAVDELGYGPPRPEIVTFTPDGQDPGVVDNTPDAPAGPTAEQAPVGSGGGGGDGGGVNADPGTGGDAGTGGDQGGGTGGGSGTRSGGTGGTGAGTTGTTVPGATAGSGPATRANGNAATGGSSTTGGLANAASVLPERTGDNRPANGDVIIVMAQGALIAAAGATLARRLGSNVRAGGGNGA